jgi:hypothetical protein
MSTIDATGRTQRRMPSFRSVVSVLVRFVVRSFSTSSRPALRAAACGGRPRPAKTRLPYRPSGRFWLLSQSIGKANLKELPHRWEAARDCFSGQMPSVGRQTLILRRNGRRLGPLPL